jgi:hypothetical protein
VILQVAQNYVHVFWVYPFFRGDGTVYPLRSLGWGGRWLLFQADLVMRNTLIDFIGGILAGIAVLFLQHASQNIEFAIGPLQVVVGEFAPPGFGFALDLFPFAFEYVFVHLILLWIILAIENSNSGGCLLTYAILADILQRACLIAIMLRKAAR